MEESILLNPSARVRALSEIGCCVTVDNSIPPRRYFRSGLEMIRMANTYMEEENYENAFILYTKFITLFVEKLPQHEMYKEASTVEKSNNTKKLKEVFPKAEKIKRILLQQYEEQKALYIEKKKQHELELERQRKLQKEEIAKRKDVNKKIDHLNEAIVPCEKNKPSPLNIPVANSSESLWPTNLLNDDQELGKPKNYNLIPEAASNVKPPKPDQFLNVIPTIDRSLKPSALLSPGVIETSNKSGYRDLIVPSGLIASFTRLAQTNTDSNIETCGILAGKLAQEKFNVTHLIVPKQSGTSDSCTTENEEDLFEYQDKYDLITLGWIHTHPSQTSFLSSVDLHTHCSYQLMLQEAIAIVIAPKYHETGIFNLTPNYGLDFIAKCKLNGFHPHPKEPPLYEESGHATFVAGSSAVVVDLRS